MPSIWTELGHRFEFGCHTIHTIHLSNHTPCTKVINLHFCSHDTVSLSFVIAIDEDRLFIRVLIFGRQEMDSTDRASLEKRPGILIIGSSNVGKRTLLSRKILFLFDFVAFPLPIAFIFNIVFFKLISTLGLGLLYNF